MDLLGELELPLVHEVRALEEFLTGLWGKPLADERGRWNPCHLPTNLQRHHLPLLAGAPTQYMASLKADGARTQLLLYQTADLIPRAALFDRRLRYYQIPGLQAPPGLYAGTLLDGELVRTATGPVLLLFDVLAYRGRARPSGASTRDALITLATLVPTQLVGGPVHFEAKAFTPLANIRALWADRARAPYPVDGLIVTPLAGNLPVLKHKEHCSVDVVLGQDRRLWYVAHDGRLEALDPATHGVELPAVFWESAPCGAVVEVNLYVVEGHLVGKLHRVRDDRPLPNSLRTVRRLLASAAEALTIEEVLDALVPPETAALRPLESLNPVAPATGGTKGKGCPKEPGAIVGGG